MLLFNKFRASAVPWAKEVNSARKSPLKRYDVAFQVIVDASCQARLRSVIQ